MPSILWSGERPDRKAPMRCVLGAAVHDLSYELVLGLPRPDPSSPFTLDPQIKQETAWVGPKRSRHSTIVDRAGVSATATDVDDNLVTFPNDSGVHTITRGSVMDEHRPGPTGHLRG